MSCNLCMIFHDGILKGECKCKNCTCYSEWLYEKNVEINKPIRTCVGCLEPLNNKDCCTNPECPINGAQD